VLNGGANSSKSPVLSFKKHRRIDRISSLDDESKRAPNLTNVFSAARAFVYIGGLIFPGSLIIPILDLASRYRFRPLVSDRLDGRQIATHLESLFRQHGAPLFLKRDNGSPFNCHHVDEVMARFGVLPLNNPPYFPRYNGSEEKSIRDLKAALDRRLQSVGDVPKDFALAVEVIANELNHRPRRCLKGRTACVVFHDNAQRLRWSKRQRKTIFRLLLQQFGAIVGNPTNGAHLRPATAWRVTVEAWLRCQDLIVVRQNQKPNVSTTFAKTWSHN